MYKRQALCSRTLAILDVLRALAQRTEIWQLVVKLAVDFQVVFVHIYNQMHKLHICNGVNCILTIVQISYIKTQFIVDVEMCIRDSTDSLFREASLVNGTYDCTT